MATIDIGTVFGQCRCCLNSGHHKRFSAPCLRQGTIRHYQDTFLECFNLFLSMSTKLPDLICSSCIQLLDAALEFKTMVVQSEQKFLSGTSSNILNRETELGLHSEVTIKEEDAESDAQYSMDYEDSNDATDAPLGTYGNVEKKMADSKLNYEVPVKTEPPSSEAPLGTDGNVEKKMADSKLNYEVPVKTEPPSSEAPLGTDGNVEKKMADSKLNYEVPVKTEPPSSEDTDGKDYYVVLQKNCCLADFLLERNQSKLCLKLKKQVYELNQARPDIRIKSQFRPNVPKCSWMVGSCKLNKLFCFVCLLSHTSSHGSWSKDGWGPEDINFESEAKAHGCSIKHIHNVLTIWRVHKPKDVMAALSNDNLKAKEVEYNKKVKRNRDLMKRFIDTVILMAKQGVPLSDSTDSKRDHYVETLHYLREYDALLDSHLQERLPDAAGLSRNIQTDIIRSIASVMKDAIKLEINQANFVAAIIEEINNKEITAVVRYATESGVEERFLGLFDVSSNNLLKIIEEYECKGKVAGQSFGVMSEEKAGVQAKLLQDSPIVFPSKAHPFNLVLSCSLENVPPFNVFFGTVKSIVRFFNRFPKCSRFLQDNIDSEMPGYSLTDWEFNSRSVNAVFDCRSQIVHTFKTVLEANESLEWDSEAILLAESLLKKLQDMQFCFLLHVLAAIFEKTDVLNNVLQTEEIDMASARKKIDSFSDWLALEFTNKFEAIYASVRQYCEAPRKQGALNKIDMKTLYQRTFIGIIKNIQKNIEYRYRAFSQMYFLDLLNKSKYVQFRNSFPRNKVRDLLTKFPGTFEFTALMHELIVFYRNSGLNKLDLVDLYSCLRSQGLQEIFPQLLRLCELSLAVPLTTKLSEESFYTLKLSRLNTYIANSKDEKFNDWALICVESCLLLQLKEKYNFYDTVLNKFVKINKKLPLEYI